MELLPLILLLLAFPIVFLFKPRFSGGLMRSRFERSAQELISNQTTLSSATDLNTSIKRKTVLEMISGTSKAKVPSARLTLRKKLKYAQWHVSPLLIYLSEALISALTFAAIPYSMGSVIRFAGLFVGPLIVRGMLNFAVERRFKRFDADYAQFLMSVVALLRTGMTPVRALETAAKGLHPKSLVKHEVELMVERMRLGVAEDRSIGSFGDEIYHTEIELFVQALLLGRQVGGNLSDTLERLARQVRKRQYFRNAASSAVALQRSSMWTILGILGAVQSYIFFTCPELVTDAWKNPTGWFVWQCAIVGIFAGLIWIREITKIKV